MSIFNIRINTDKPEVKEAIAVAEPCKETVATKVAPTFRFRLRDGHLLITESQGDSFPNDGESSMFGHRYTTQLSRSDAKTLLEFLLENRSDLQ